jgi:hypothetical protein
LRLRLCFLASQLGSLQFGDALILSVRPSADQVTKANRGNILGRLTPIQNIEKDLLQLCCKGKETVTGASSLIENIVRINDSASDVDSLLRGMIGYLEHVRYAAAISRKGSVVLQEIEKVIPNSDGIDMVWRLRDSADTFADEVGAQLSTIKNKFLDSAASTQFTNWVKYSFENNLKPRYVYGSIPPGYSLEEVAKLLKQACVDRNLPICPDLVSIDSQISSFIK